MIAVLPILMLKSLSTKSAKSRKGVIRVGDDGKKKYSDKAELDGRNKVGSNKIDGIKVGDNDIAERKHYQKIPKFEKLSKSKMTIRSLDFFTLATRLTFIKLR